MDIRDAYYTQNILPTLRSTNVVATANLDRGVDLDDLAKNNPNILIHRGTFAAANIRLMKPKAVFSLYESGTMVCMGTDTKASALAAVLKFVRILNIYGIKCKSKGMYVYNNVACAKIPFWLDLNKLLRNWGHAVKYTNGVFPAATVTCANLPIDPPSNLTWALFESGNMNATGAMDMEEIERVLRWLYINIIHDIELLDAELLAAVQKKKAPRKVIKEYTRVVQRNPLEEDDEDDGEEEEEDTCDDNDYTNPLSKKRKLADEVIQSMQRINQKYT